MRELLEPYFSRVRFTKEQKKRWFRERQGLLFGGSRMTVIYQYLADECLGFGVGFYLILKVPLLGVLIYGLAEASTAYLITKITDPPPPPTESEGFAETQVAWKNKHKFLNFDLTHIIDGKTDDVGDVSNEKLAELHVNGEWPSSEDSELRARVVSGSKEL